MVTHFNKILYIAFVLLAVYHALIRKDYIEAATTMGIGLIFDPFDATKTWNQRSYWQRAVPLVHLVIAAAFLGFGIGLNDK